VPAIGRIIDKYKMAKHFDLTVSCGVDRLLGRLQ
jgi:hypothetical protein